MSSSSTVRTSAAGRTGNDARPSSRFGLSGPSWCTIRALDAGPRELLAACAELGIEGAVAKRADSPYRPGVRSADWLKLKTAEWKSEHASMRLSR